MYFRQFNIVKKDVVATVLLNMQICSWRSIPKLNLFEF